MINYKALYLFYDIETTGTDPNTDRIVSLAYRILDPGFNELAASSTVCNPGIPIPKAASSIHGITDEVASASTHTPADLIISMIWAARNAVMDLEKSQGAKSVMRLIVCGYNHTGFDNHFVCAELGRNAVPMSIWNFTQIDTYTLMKAAAPTLSSHKLAEVYRLVTGEELKDAHDAMADVDATITVFRALLKAPLPFQTAPVNFPPQVDDLYTWKFSLEEPVDSEGKFKFDHAGKAYVTFGKHKGMHLDKMARQEPGFLQWMLRGDFADDTKQIARDALSGVFPNRAEG